MKKRCDSFIPMESLKVPLILLIALIAIFLVTAPFKPAVVKPRDNNNDVPAVVAPDLGANLRKANAALDKNNFNEVINLLTPFKNSDDHVVLSLLGYAFAGIKDFPASAQSFEKALAKKKDTRYGYSLAYIYETMGEQAKAKVVYDDLVTAPLLPKPTRIKVLLGIARCSLLLNDHKAAFNAFKTVIGEDPTKEEAFVGLIKLFKLSGKSAGIDKVREKGDPLHGESFQYNFWLGCLYFETGEYEKAFVVFKKAATINPQNSSPHYYIYRILKKSKRTDEAINEIEKFYTINPCLPYVLYQAALDAKEENRLDVSFKFLRSSITMDRSLLGRDDKGTFSAVEQYVKKNGTPEEKVFLKAFLEFINSNFNVSLKLITEALPSIKDQRLKEDAERLIRNCQKVIYNEEKYNDYLSKINAAQQQAMTALKTNLSGHKPNEKESPVDELKRKALSNPRDAKLQYSTALELARLGDVEGSKLFLRETIRANPRLAEPFYSLGKIARFEGNVREAEENLKEALKLSPRNTQTLSLMAAIHLENGDITNAVNEAKSAISSNPNNYEARFVLAQAYIQNQDTEKAMEEIKLGLKYDPNMARRQEFMKLRKQLRAN